MVRSLVILLMLAATCHAEWYTGTNADGRVVSVPVRTDPSLAYVVGAISTSDAPYAPSVQLVPQEFDGGIWIKNTNAYIIVRQPDGHDYAFIPVDGTVIAPQVSFSPLELDKVPGYVESEKTNYLARKARMQAIKDSPEWSAITNNLAQYDLAQYDLHESQWQTLRATATNAIASTTGANKTALNAVVNLIEKERQARDDVKTIANRTKGILLDKAKELK